MTSRVLSLKASSLLGVAALLLTPLTSLGQAAAPQASPDAANSQSAKPQDSAAPGKDRWLHVRVENQQNKNETVRVNLPVEFAEKVLPAIDHDQLHDGKVRIDCIHHHGNDVDLRALADAVRTAKEGEYVTVQSDDEDVRVAKESGHLIVHVLDKGRSRKSQVEIKIPMKVVEALFSAGKDELDLVAALHVLSAQGDTELASVKDEDSTVRVWIDSRNGTY